MFSQRYFLADLSSNRDRRLISDLVHDLLDRQSTSKPVIDDSHPGHLIQSRPSEAREAAIYRFGGARSSYGGDRVVEGKSLTEQASRLRRSDIDCEAYGRLLRVEASSV